MANRLCDCTEEDMVVSQQLAVDISELLLLTSEILSSKRYFGFSSSDMISRKQ